MSLGAYINKREVTGRFRVKPGNYVLIPSTYEAEKEGQFLVRIFTEGASTGHSLNMAQPDTVIHSHESSIVPCLHAHHSRVHPLRLLKKRNTSFETARVRIQSSLSRSGTRRSLSRNATFSSSLSYLNGTLAVHMRLCRYGGYATAGIGLLCCLGIYGRKCCCKKKNPSSTPWSTSNKSQSEFQIQCSREYCWKIFLSCRKRFVVAVPRENGCCQLKLDSLFLLCFASENQLSSTRDGTDDDETRSRMNSRVSIAHSPTLITQTAMKIYVILCRSAVLRGKEVFDVHHRIVCIVENSQYWLIWRRRTA